METCLINYIGENTTSDLMIIRFSQPSSLILYLYVKKDEIMIDPCKFGGAIISGRELRVAQRIIGSPRQSGLN